MIFDDASKGEPILIKMAGGQVVIGKIDGIYGGLFLRLLDPVQCSYSPGRPWAEVIEKGLGRDATLKPYGPAGTTHYFDVASLRDFGAYRHAYPRLP